MPNPSGWGTWSDFWQAVGALASLLAISWGFIQLFRRDRKREAEINSLIDIAQKQNEISQAMQDQVKELARHTMIMQEGNDINREILALDKEDADYVKKERGLEERARKKKLAPNINFVKHSSNPSSGTIIYGNSGGTAHIIEVTTNPGSPLKIYYGGPKTIPSLERLEISLSQLEAESNCNISNFSGTVIMSDDEGDKYTMRINRSERQYGISISPTG